MLLKGVEEDGNRILLARLNVQQQGGKITNITADRVHYDPRAKPPARTRLRWPHQSAGHVDRLRPRGHRAAVKINRQADRLVLFPYPRNKRSA